MGDLVEHLVGVGDVAGEGVRGDELGEEGGVLVESGAVDLGVELGDVRRVGAAVEVGEVAVEEAAVGGPLRGAEWE